MHLTNYIAIEANRIYQLIFSLYPYIFLPGIHISISCIYDHITGIPPFLSNGNLFPLYTMQ